MDSNSPWTPNASMIADRPGTKSSSFSWASFANILIAVVEVVAIIGIEAATLGAATPGVAAGVAGEAAAVGAGEGVAAAAAAGETIASETASTISYTALEEAEMMGFDSVESMEASGVELTTYSDGAAIEEATGTAENVTVQDSVTAISKEGFRVPRISKAVAPWVQLGVGLTSAGANAAVAGGLEHRFSWLNLGIDVGAAFFPIIGEARDGLKLMKLVHKNALSLLQEADRIGMKSAKALDKKFFQQIRRAGQVTDEHMARLEHISELRYKAAGFNAKNATTDQSLCAAFCEFDLPKEGYIASASNYTINKVKRRFLTRTLKDAKMIKERQAITGLEALYQTIDSGAWREAVSIWTPKETLIKGLQSINKDIKADVIANLFEDQRIIRKAEIVKTLAGNKLKDVLKVLNPNQLEVVNGIMSAAGHMRGWKIMARAENRFNHYKEWKLMYKQFEASLTPLQRGKISNILTKSWSGYDSKMISSLIRTSKGLETPLTLKRSIRFLGSAKFNKYGVQLLQTVDPNDLGRLPIELAYQKTKTAIDKLMDKMFKRNLKDIKKMANKISKGYVTLEQAWLKSGGKLIQPNRYIIGYKVIDTTTATKGVGTAISETMKHHLVMIKFNQLSTGNKLHEETKSKVDRWGETKTSTVMVRRKKQKGRGTRNTHGKPNIIVRMTDEQLAKFANLEGSDAGVVYWFRVGKRNGWFVSRGGKTSGTGALQLSTKLSLFLSFVPIPALRNLLSISSNWVENISAMSKGQYLERWSKKFTSSIERASINRAGRLMSRVVLGGIAKHVAGNHMSNTKFKNITKWIGNNAGRELQRFTSATLSSYEHMSSAGVMEWKGPTNKSTQGRILGLAGMTSVQSAVRRKARGSHSRAAKIQSFRTKARQVRRIPGAATPNSVFKPRNFGNFKVK